MIDRERALRTATFWLRPDFLLRVTARFQQIAGFDRAIALASSALTALVPLIIFIGAVLPNDRDAADIIIRRYGLSGEGASAVEGIFRPADDVDASIGLVGLLMLIVAVLSFTRAIQRLFETTWELPPVSVRNTVGGIQWISGTTLFLAAEGAIIAILDGGILRDSVAALVGASLFGGYLIWTGRVLSYKRLTASELLPFAVAAMVIVSAYQAGASIYTPWAFDSYAERYGAIGSVFALISALFGLMLALVGSAALGREIRVELDRIARGERPSEDELKRQWDSVIAGVREARARFEVAMRRGRPAEDLLFSYGTLQQPEVQIATFGRQLAGEPAQLAGHRVEMVQITDPEVIAASGSDRHPVLVADEDAPAIAGTVFVVGAAELAAADRYEVDDYERVQVPLTDGRTAWVYVQRKRPATA